MRGLQITEAEVFPDWVEKSPWAYIRGLKPSKRKLTVVVNDVNEDYEAFHPDNLIVWFDWKVTTRRKTFSDIKRECCQKYSVSRTRFEGPSHDQVSVLCRQEAWYRGRKELGVSTPRMGELSGNRDHSTVVSGIKRYTAHLSHNKLQPPTSP